MGIPDDQPVISGQQSVLSSSSFHLDSTAAETAAVEVLSVIRYSGATGGRSTKPNTPTTGRSVCSSADSASLASQQQHCTTCDQPRHTHQDLVEIVSVEEDIDDVDDQQEERQRHRRRGEEKKHHRRGGRERHRSSASKLSGETTAVLGSRRSSAPEIDHDSTVDDEAEEDDEGDSVQRRGGGLLAYTRSLERTLRPCGQNNNNNNNHSGRSSDSEAAPATRTAQHRRKQDLERAVAQVQDSFSGGRLSGQRSEAERTEIKAVVHRAEAAGGGKGAENSGGGGGGSLNRKAMVTQQKRYSGNCDSRKGQFYVLDIVQTQQMDLGSVTEDPNR